MIINLIQSFESLFLYVLQNNFMAHDEHIAP